MVKNPWRDGDVMPTTAEGTPTGVPLVAVTANYYCWLQTGGYAPLYVDTSETLVKGGPVGYPGTPNVAGAVGDIEAGTDATWGIAVYVATAGEVAIVDLDETRHKRSPLLESSRARLCHRRRVFL